MHWGPKYNAKDNKHLVKLLGRGKSFFSTYFVLRMARGALTALIW